MKRTIDVGLALFTLLCLSPLFLGVMLVIALSDRGPVFYVQRRVGLGGREFSMFKFRSMVINADRLGGYSTADGDNRITPVGRFIRRTSLDELPQILNVLAGDMSLVGPRPDVPDQRKIYTEAEWQLRTSVRPGITGLAQAKLRSQASVEERKRLDLEYASKVSVANDCRIIALTFRQIFGKGGN